MFIFPKGVAAVEGKEGEVMGNEGIEGEVRGRVGLAWVKDGQVRRAIWVSIT